MSYQSITQVTPNTFEVSCHCGCGEVVTATDAGFNATTVDVAACSGLAKQGIASTTWRKSSLAIVTERIARHRWGLVTIQGSTR